MPSPKIVPHPQVNSAICLRARPSSLHLTPLSAYARSVVACTHLRYLPTPAPLSPRLTRAVVPPKRLTPPLKKSLPRRCAQYPAGRRCGRFPGGGRSELRYRLRAIAYAPLLRPTLYRLRPAANGLSYRLHTIAYAVLRMCYRLRSIAYAAR
eukprot:3051925-Rhodomonas_salina.1